MELSTKNLKINGKKLKISIILPYFNDKIGLTLLNNTKKELLKNHVQEKNIEVVRVSGALEIPLACQKIIKKKKPSAIIALGVIIRGETSHYDLVTKTAYNGIMEIQLKHNTPIIFGVLTCETAAQAQKRASENGLNKGKQFAQSALLQSTL